MADFTVINTQEEFDAAISSRLKRERDSITKTLQQKYIDDGYLSPDQVTKLKADYDKQIGELTTAAEATGKKLAAYEKDIADRDATIKKYETASVKARVAHEIGLPYELAGRLSGETEEDIRKDAEALFKLVGKPARTADPLGKSEPSAEKGKPQPGTGYQNLARALADNN